MSKTILIVDDSAVMRSTLTSVLSQEGFFIVEADNGQSALDRAAQAKVDLIISDVNMPVMDGLTFARKIKENPDYRFVPIIMLTTVTGQSEMEAGKAAGVRAWMIKPFEKPKLLAAVSKLLG